MLSCRKATWHRFKAPSGSHQRMRAYRRIGQLPGLRQGLVNKMLPVLKALCHVDRAMSKLLVMRTELPEKPSQGGPVSPGMSSHHPEWLDTLLLPECCLEQCHVMAKRRSCHGGQCPEEKPSTGGPMNEYELPLARVVEQLLKALGQTGLLKLKRTTAHLPRP